jgi:hypothetical protein
VRTFVKINLLIVAGLMCLPFYVHAQDSRVGDIERAADWLLAQQAEDGGWSDGFSERSGPGLTVDVILALNAAGVDVQALEPSPIAFLKNYTNLNASQIRAALAAQFTLAAVALGEDVTRFGGVNLIDVLQNDRNEAGLIGDSVYEHCLAVLALRAAEVDPSPEDIDLILQNQNEDGGWGFFEAALSDSNTTALCMQTLAPTDAAIEAALDYLRETQNLNAGWAFQTPSDFGSEIDAYSTASVIVALRAAGEELLAWGDPTAILYALQTEEGAFRYNRDQLGAEDPFTNIIATAAAVSALSIH